MSLKAILSSLEGLDESVAKLYTKDASGKFILDVDGMVDKSKLDDFRTNNTTLKGQLEELQKKFEAFSGIDPSKYKEAIEKLQSEEEKKLLKAGNIDEVVAQRTDRMRTEFQEQLVAKDKAIEKLKGEATTAGKERDTYIVEAELRRQVDSSEFGFQPGVTELVKEQVLKEFGFRDGKVIRLKPDGSPMFGRNGDPGTLGEFLQDVVKTSPYLVKSSTGGGARNAGNGAGGANGKRTIKRSEWNALDPIKQAEASKTANIID